MSVDQLHNFTKETFPIYIGDSNEKILNDNYVKV